MSADAELALIAVRESIYCFSVSVLDTDMTCHTVL